MQQELTPSQVISAKILFLKSEGYSTREAVDAVLGLGTYDRIAGEVYDRLNA